MHSDDIIHITKKATRAYLNKQLKQLSLQQIAVESDAVAHFVRKSDWFSQSPLHVGIYLSFPLELDTTQLLQELLHRRSSSQPPNVRIFIPHMADITHSVLTFLEITSQEDLHHNFECNRWGIREPKDHTIPHRVDAFRDDIPLHLLLVPGLGFDKSCRRLGRGKGYYDNFLARLEQRYREALPSRPFPMLVGLSLQCQLIDEIPVTKSDYPLDCVITSQGKYENAKKKHDQVKGV